MKQTLRAFAAAIMLALMAASSVLVPAAEASGGECSVPEFSIDAEEQAFFEILNDYRASKGLTRLKWSANLSRTAEWMVRDMSGNDRFGHEDSLGRSPFVRSVDCGYPVPAGENLAAGTNRSTAASAFELLRKSPSHDENMLTDYYVQVGVARLHAPGSKYTWYWAIEMGPVDDGTSMGAGEAAPPVAASVSLPGGANLITWAGETMPASQAAATMGPGVETIYAFDAAGNRWLRYAPGAPSYVNTLSALTRGGAYWVISGGTVTLPAESR